MAVGAGDILFDAYNLADFFYIAAGNALHFSGRVVAWVNTYAAFGATVGNAHHSCFNRHPRRKRHGFRKADLLVKTHAAFAWATAKIVLHAVPFEMFDTTIVHFDRDIHN